MVPLQVCCETCLDGELAGLGKVCGDLGPCNCKWMQCGTMHTSRKIPQRDPNQEKKKRGKQIGPQWAQYGPNESVEVESDTIFANAASQLGDVSS